MNVDVYKVDGQTSGDQVELADTVFNVADNPHVVHQVVKAHLANRRQGTHSTKNRTAVRGGGKKPWKQKGRGVARAGTSRSPLWVGGGRIFGPEPRDYTQKINKKVRRLARKSVLSSRLREDRLRVTEDFSIDSGKTRDMADLIAGLRESRNVRALILTAEVDQNLLQASKNIPNLQVMRADMVSTYDLISSRQILLQRSAVQKLEEILG